MIAKITYAFTSVVWQYAAPNGWYFVSLPVALSQEIRVHLKWQEEGWGRLKASAQIGTTHWETAIWFDTKHNTYVLPLKSDIRKKEKLDAGSTVDVTIKL